ncbi:MAG: zinc ribbon domain-containing protein [Promethearchaeota archaeon]
MKIKTVEKEVLRDFKEFGSYIQIVAILSILSFIFPFTGFIQLIFIFLALSAIKKVCRVLPNLDLMEFRSRYIISFITLLFGLSMMGTGIASMMLLMFGFRFRIFLPSIIAMALVILIGLIVLVISGVIQYRAWNSLSKFFEENKTMFPESIGKDALKGSNNVKYGIILTMTLILAIVGIILIIVGYFQIASLKKINNEYDQPVVVRQNTASPYTQTQTIQLIQKTPRASKNFCPRCGTKLEDIASFCPMCGLSLEN